jgi:hypothetical protein
MNPQTNMKVMLDPSQKKHLSSLSSDLKLNTFGFALVGGKNILVVFHENSKKDPNDPNVPKPNNPQI